MMEKTRKNKGIKRANHRPNAILKTDKELQEEYYSINEVAVILKVHHNTIRNAIHQKRLNAVMFGNKWLIPKSELQDNNIFKEYNQAYTSLSNEGQAVIDNIIDDLSKLKDKDLKNAYLDYISEKIKEVK